MQQPKPFAKLFVHPEIGQVLVQRSSDEDDTPGIEIKFDPAVEGIAPSHVFLAVRGVDEDAAEEAADCMFEGFTEAEAFAAAAGQIAAIKQYFSQKG